MNPALDKINEKSSRVGKIREKLASLGINAQAKYIKPKFKLYGKDNTTWAKIHIIFATQADMNLFLLLCGNDVSVTKNVILVLEGEFF